MAPQPKWTGEPKRIHDAFTKLHHANYAAITAEIRRPDLSEQETDAANHCRRRINAAFKAYQDTE